MSERQSIAELAWPVERATEMIEVLARHAGLRPRRVDAASVRIAEEADIRVSIEAVASWLDIEAEWHSYPAARTAEHIRETAPSIYRLPGPKPSSFLAILSARGRRARVIGPTGAIFVRSLEDIREALCGEVEKPLLASAGKLLENTDISASRKQKLRRKLVRQQLAAARLPHCFELRTPPTRAFMEQARETRLTAKLAGIAACQIAGYLLWIASWATIGAGALQGRFDRGWILAWALLLLTMIPVRLAGLWFQGLFSTGFGGLLKQRLFAGALRLDPDQIRGEGAGQLLGRVTESESVEALSLSGGFSSVVAVFQLAVSAGVLLNGAGGWPQAAALVAWTALILFTAWIYYRRRRRWTRARMSLTHDLVESMAGHRTRLAQQFRENWHDGEDEALANYIALSADMDRASAWLLGLASRGWVVVGLALLAPAFASGSAATGALAVSLGGVVLAQAALRQFATGLAAIAGATIAWEQAAPLFDPKAEYGSPVTVTPGAGPVLEAHNVVFRHGSRQQAVIRGADLIIAQGDWVLLEGVSGCGKSTFAALASGLRNPESGLILLNGIDRQTIGPPAWRRRVASAPQYHENHVLTNTFLFNLGMGKPWPPRREDIVEGEAICRELGLGSLIDKMPGGMFQPVGETGWQLSQGERSRLFMARALLQGGDLIVLDESFAALDPYTARLALECLKKRARTALVVAHP